MGVVMKLYEEIISLMIQYKVDSIHLRHFMDTLDDEDRVIQKVTLLNVSDMVFDENFIRINKTFDNDEVKEGVTLLPVTSITKVEIFENVETKKMELAVELSYKENSVIEQNVISKQIYGDGPKDKK
jgi:hypothetical protein